MTESAGTPTTVHICYVHGWQGDHTSFQSFPTDLHEHLVPRLPENVVLNTHIYPTYKAARPIQEATVKLLKWLETITEGFVILAGHSLGGFLTADAAVESNRIQTLKQRIIGVIAFDVPYLGIDPHVIISGIASILPKEGRKESEMNDQTKVNIVDPHDSNVSLASPPTSPPPSQPSFFKKAADFLHKHQDPIGYTKKYITEFFEFGSCVIDKEGLSARYLALENWGSPDPAKGGGGDWIHFFTVTVPDEDERERLRQAPPITMSDPNPLGDSSPYIFHPRHANTAPPALVGGIGVEVNPYGEDHSDEEINATGSGAEFNKFKEKARKEKEKFERTRAEKAAANARKKLAETRSMSPSLEIARPDSVRSRSSLSVPGSPQSSTSDLSIHSLDSHHSDASTGDGSGKRKKRHHPHHFIVLPWTMGYRWQGIRIAGVENEVEAHTGIFFKHQNFEYDSLVVRVGNFVLGVVS